MTSLVILTLALLSVALAPSGLVRTGRWSRAAYRNWLIGVLVVYVVAVALILTRFGGALRS